jgi:hypothetical protein
MNQLPDFGADFSTLNWGRHRQYIFHWSEVNSGQVSIKLYEPGNYAFRLRKVDKKNNQAIDEFDKPQFEDSDIDTSLLTTLNLNGTSVNYSFRFNKLDVSMWEFYRNLFFYIIAAVVWITLVAGIAYFTGDWRAALGVGLGAGTLIFGGVGYFI